MVEMPTPENGTDSIVPISLRALQSFLERAIDDLRYAKEAHVRWLAATQVAPLKNLCARLSAARTPTAVLAALSVDEQIALLDFEIEVAEAEQKKREEASNEARVRKDSLERERGALIRGRKKGT